MLQERQKSYNPITTQNLVQEINDLKEEIIILKQNNKNLDNRISKLEGDKFSDDNINDQEKDFLQTLEMVTSQKWNDSSKRKMWLPSQGGRGPNNILVQHGGHRLIASNIAESSASSSIPRPNDPLYGKFMEFLKNKKRNNPSYANALNEEENEDLQEYHQSPYKEKIIFLEYQDVMRYFDSRNDPWILMSRYLDNAPYVVQAYKGRAYYKNILKFTGSIEVTHFTAANSNVYNFSKVLIKQIISVEEWDYQAQVEFRKEKENPTPYQRIVNKLKSQGRNNLSKEEILEEYLKEMKEDLVRNFEYQKSDSSMKASSEDENQFNCLAGESQPEKDSEEIPLEDIFEEIKNTVSRRINKGESSNEKQKTTIMPLKRTSTSAASAMTQAAIRQLVADSVAAALEAQAANVENTDNTNRNPEPRETPVARKCTYKEFMSCQPFYFNVRKELLVSSVGLSELNQKMEDEFYNLVVKGNDLKTYARRFQELATLCPNMVPNNEKL
nr:reverse transcriptase domain-containing protein [Tanacetum cinerariifolium]